MIYDYTTLGHFDHGACSPPDWRLDPHFGGSKPKSRIEYYRCNFCFFGAATNYLQLFILDINRLKEPAPPQARAPIQEPARAQEPAPPQAPVPTQEATPTSSVLIYIRLSGIVLIIGNIIFVAIGLLPLSLYTQPTFISSIDVILGTTLLLVSLGLPALQMKQSYQTRWVGLSSVAALCTSYLLFAIVYFLRNINYYQINYPLFYVAIALIVIGNVLLGIAIMRASTFPRWTGVLLIVSGIIWIGWFMIPSLSPGTLLYIIINAAILPGSIALIDCGYTLLQQSKGNASTLSSSSS